MQTKTPVKWEEKTLGELCISIDDGDWIESKNQSSVGIRLVQTGNIGNGFFKNKGEKAKFISEETFKKLNCMEIFENDCLVSRLPDPLGRACLIPKLSERMITAVDCAILKFDLTKILPQYFVYYSLSNKYLSDAKSHSSGATRQRISRTNLGTISIPISSLDEQQRIVEILDKAFEDIEQMKENAKQNLQNIKDLFDSYLQSIFKNINWETKTIEKVCKEIFAGGDAPKNNYSWEENEKYRIPIYANAVKDNGLYGYTDFARVTEPSITISARGSGTGHTEIRFNPYFPIVRLIVLIPNLSLINLRFLKYSIDNLDILKSGTAIPQLTVPMIKGYNLPLPTLEEQQYIIQKLDSLQEETKQLEQIYQQKIKQAEELKQSILQKAFNGEL